MTSGRDGAAERRPILITGGAGFIGTNLANRMLRQGRPVIIYDSLSRPGSERNLRWLRATHGSLVRVEIADVRATARLRDATAEAGTVFHLASQVAVTTSLDDPTEDFAINAAATLELLELLRQRGGAAGLIFTSTNKVYGAIDDIDLVERDSATSQPAHSPASVSPKQGHYSFTAPTAVRRAPPTSTCSIMHAATVSQRPCCA